MKKLRIILSIAAFAIAIGVTYSSQLRSDSALTAIDGYEYVSGGSPQCVRRILACDNAGSNDCTFGVSEVILRENNTGTCGNNLKKM